MIYRILQPSLKSHFRFLGGLAVTTTRQVQREGRRAESVGEEHQNGIWCCCYLWKMPSAIRWQIHHHIPHGQQSLSLADLELVPAITGEEGWFSSPCTLLSSSETTPGWGRSYMPFSLLENAIWYTHLRLRGTRTINNNSGPCGFMGI